MSDVFNHYNTRIKNYYLLNNSDSKNGTLDYTLLRGWILSEDTPHK